MKQKNTAVFEDYSTEKHSIEMEVNWDKTLTEYIKLLFDGKEAYIKRSDLFAMMFVLATPEQQEDMIPVTRKEMKPYERQHRVKVTKDLKEGDELVVNCIVHVPSIIDESIRAEISGQKKEEGV